MQRFIDTSLSPIAYSAQGKGSTSLVFIHNAGGSKAFYEGQKPLSKKYHCVFIDLPGHGNSPPPKINPTLKDMAQALCQVCEHLKLKKVIIIGLNLGGNIAWHLASMKPSFLKGTIAIDPPCFMTHKFAAELKKHMAKIQTDERLDHLKKLVSSSFVRAPNKSYLTALKALKKADVATLVSLYEDMLKEDVLVSSLIKSIKTKLHVISTDANFCSISHLESSSANATFSKVFGSLYWACLEVPKQVNAIIDRFIEIHFP